MFEFIIQFADFVKKNGVCVRLSENTCTKLCYTNKKKQNEVDDYIDIRNSVWLWNRKKCILKKNNFWTKCVFLHERRW